MKKSRRKWIWPTNCKKITKKVTLNISNFSLTLFECEISFQFLSSQAFNWDLKDCELWSSLFIEPLLLNSGPSRRKRLWLMFHPVQAHCALIGWNYCTGMHPLISPKALILRSKLFNSHIKTCKISLWPRWRSASFFWRQTQEMIVAKGGGGSDASHSCIHTCVGFKQNWTIVWIKTGYCSNMLVEYWQNTVQ